MLDRLMASDFSPLLNQTFRIRVSTEESTELELIEVTELGPASDKGGDPTKRQPFSIIFRGPQDLVLPQNIYEIEHQQLGTLGLFIVPISPDKEGMRYEAVFN